jgi:hypothetical protein
VWDHFKQVVIWSHVYCHWGREVVAKRSSHAVRTIFPEKSAQDVRKRQAQRQLDIEQSGQRWHRAKRLARDEVAKLSYLETVAKGTPDTVDGKFRPPDLLPQGFVTQL